MANSHTLTKRELDVLRCFANGTPTGKVAAHLRISERTVRAYLAAAMRKLGARSRVHAVAIALRRHIIDGE